jgi:thioredoxin reductase
MTVPTGDVVVVGAGPAGLAAAVRASEGGARRVTIIDQAAAAGGQIWRRDGSHPLPRAASEWIRRAHDAGVKVVHGAEVVDARAGEGVSIANAESGGAWVSASDIMLATGARELFLPFPGWTLPGVTGAAGLQALVKHGANVRGKRVVVSGTGPLLLPAAATLARHGAQLVIVAEQTPQEKLRAFAMSLWRTPWQLAEAAALRGAFLKTPYRAGTWVTRADGDRRLREVTLTDGKRTWREACDFLACGYGLVPNTELARLLGCVVDAHGIVTGAEQGTSVAGVYAAGECTGVAGAAAAIAAGERAGRVLRSARAVSFSSAPQRADDGSYRARLAAAFSIRREVRALATPETIVCRCEDVRMADVAPAQDAREAKLHTRAGMGACQGRVCGAALEALKGWTPAAPRPPLYPVPVGMLAPPRGDTFHP